jgi:hypothetical protein
MEQGNRALQESLRGLTRLHGHAIQRFGVG